MILQTDNRLIEQINKYGCYLMSMIYLANKHTGLKVSTRKINGWYNDFNSNGWLDECWVLDPNAILKALGMNVEYTGKHEFPDYNIGSEGIEILCLKNEWGTHFVVGNGKGEITYNPLGIKGEGKIISKRVFKYAE